MIDPSPYSPPRSACWGIPAVMQLIYDPVVAQSPTAIRLYFHLLTELDLSEVRHVKAGLIAEILCVERTRVVAGFNLLTDRGYLVEYERTTNHMRQFTLAYSRASGASSQTTQPKQAS